MADPVQTLDHLATLSDGVRLRMLHIMEGQPLAVNDLADVLQLPQSTVSRHLKHLSQHGWLTSQRQGTSHQYGMMTEELSTEAGALWDLIKRQTAELSPVVQDRLRLASVMSARHRDSRRFFAGAAGDWDQLRLRYFGSGFTVDAMLSLLDPSLVVADLGCGTGAIIERLAGHVARVVGVDNSADMLASARRHLSGFANVELHAGDLTSVPLADASLDAAMCVLSLSYLPELPVPFREIARVLRPGGRVVIVDVLPHDREDFRRQIGQVHRGFSSEQLTGLLTAAGFGQIVFRPLPPDPQAMGPALFVCTAARKDFRD